MKCISERPFVCLKGHFTLIRIYICNSRTINEYNFWRLSAALTEKARRHVDLISFGALSHSALGNNTTTSYIHNLEFLKGCFRVILSFVYTVCIFKMPLAQCPQKSFWKLLRPYWWCSLGLQCYWCCYPFAIDKKDFKRSFSSGKIVTCSILICMSCIYFILSLCDVTWIRIYIIYKCISYRYNRVYKRQADKDKTLRATSFPHILKVTLI